MSGPRYTAKNIPKGLVSNEMRIVGRTDILPNETNHNEALHAVPATPDALIFANPENSQDF